MTSELHIPLISCVFLLSACSEKSIEESSEKSQNSVVPILSTQAVKTSKILLTKGAKWVDRKLPDGTQIRLFTAPPFPPDSRRSYSLTESDTTYAIIIDQYGKSWIATIIGFIDAPESSETVTGLSPESCLQQLREKHKFTGEFRDVTITNQIE